MRKIFSRMAIVGGMLALMVMPVKAQKWEHLADTPQMGWSTWNKFQGNISEDIIKGIADVMVESGLRDAGYTYINIDDCWHGKRDADGFIQADPVKFPHGMKALADYVHSRGLKLGIYSDAGTETCGGMPGSLGHEYQDAIQYARWEVDYLKYDWCNTTNVNPQGAYQLISDALRSAGRPIFLSMCEWGSSHPWRWARDIGHSWRTTPDIWCNFDSLRVFPGYSQFGVMQCIQLNDSLRQYAGRGHWNDPDMLQVGNGVLTMEENRSHFTMWCMLAAPLLAGNDIRKMDKETLGILTNKEVIAVNQDKLGKQGGRYMKVGEHEIWVKQLSNGEAAVCFFNRDEQPWNVETVLQKENLSFADVRFWEKEYKVRDLWKHKDIGSTKDKMQFDIPAHGVVLLKLTPKQ